MSVLLKQGNPALHLPAKIEALTSAAPMGLDPSNVVLLEASASDWIKQIKDALSRTPDTVPSHWQTLVLDDPSPKWELQFWDGYFRQLDLLNKQLQQPQIVACIHTLSNIHHPIAKHILALKSGVKIGK
jgi:cell division septal protein FtsQ